MLCGVVAGLCMHHRLGKQVKLKSYVLQALMLGVFAWLIYQISLNVHAHMQMLNMHLGFDFLWQSSRFQIHGAWLAHDPTYSYWYVLMVGLCNTIIMGLLAIFYTTLLSLVFALIQQMGGTLASRLVNGYVGLLRNIPLVIQIMFIYTWLIKTLPPFRETLIWHGLVLNNRGIHLPWISIQLHDTVTLMMLLCVAWLLFILPKKNTTTLNYLQTGLKFGFVLLVGWLLVTIDLSWSIPQLVNRFSYGGGVTLYPEFLALLMGLVLYTSSYGIEIFRAGFLSIPKGQYEAACALGLTPLQRFRYVILPQSVRLIVPPMLNQYLNIIKDTSLGVTIGYPELMGLFAGTVLNQTGHGIEIILITMGVYLAFNLLFSLLIQCYQRRSQKWSI